MAKEIKLALKDYGILVRPVYRQCAVSYTDFWSAYGTVFPQKRHKAVGKETGMTNYIERFNNTMRQRISRLVRKTLSFSKKLSNHIGAIWYFLHSYNANLSIQIKTLIILTMQDYSFVIGFHAGFKTN